MEGGFVGEGGQGGVWQRGQRCKLFVDLGVEERLGRLFMHLNSFISIMINSENV